MTSDMLTDDASGVAALETFLPALKRRSPLGRLIILPMAAAAIFALAGCGGPHIDKIGDLNDNPGKYMHQDVTVTGEVTRVYDLPLGIANIAAYRVNDGTGQIWVVTHRGAPNQGDHLGLRGELEPIADIGGNALGNLFGNVIEEHNRKFAD